MRGVFTARFKPTLVGLVALAAACKQASDDSDPRAGAEAPAEIVADPRLPGLGPPSPQLERRLADALESKGPGYAPRTHHLGADGRPQYTNRLILESSPYLLQHAHNPVNWYPWGDEAFDRAAREGKPVLLSIGYSTCHWCHVMERESFEDEAIAAFVNEHYVAIKVDREQRPDVDDVYMSAVQLMTGRGGWPMTLLLTPERQPFFAGTYIPARDGDRGARKGLLSILGEMHARYESRPQAVVAEATQISRKLQRAATSGPSGSVPGPDVIGEAVGRLLDAHDDAWGGFGSAPKFPRPANLELLLRYARRSGDARALAAVELTLDKMIAGGIHDHVGGGFHRYSTDAHWLVPHFEKMLYDNAQLAVVLVEAYQSGGKPEYAEVARETLDYLDREMSASGGGFYSATDADSLNPNVGHDEEGWFFTWTRPELESALGESSASRIVAYFGVTDRGDLDGRNILHASRPVAEVAKQLEIGVSELQRDLDEARPLLYARRQRRPPPLRDEKILASWNGLAISAFARAGFALDEPRYVERAARATEFVLAELRDEAGRLLRSHHPGRSSPRGYLDDYAFVIQALLDLHEATSELRWLEDALALQDLLDAHFWDAGGGAYFLTADDSEALLVRQKPDYDGAEPAGNSVAALNLLRLAEITGRADLGARADGIFEAMANLTRRSPGSVPKLLVALDYRLDRPLDVFVIAPGNSSAPSALVDVLRRVYVPNRVVTINDEAGLATHARLIPALSGKRALEGRATAFVCERGICQLPTSDPDVFARQLRRVTGYGG